MYLGAFQQQAAYLLDQAAVQEAAEVFWKTYVPDERMPASPTRRCGGLQTERVHPTSTTSHWTGEVRILTQCQGLCFCSTRRVHACQLLQSLPHWTAWQPYVCRGSPTGCCVVSRSVLGVVLCASGCQLHLILAGLCLACMLARC
jgi:hypothetical protein